MLNLTKDNLEFTAGYIQVSSLILQLRKLSYRENNLLGYIVLLHGDYNRAMFPNINYQMEVSTIYLLFQGTLKKGREQKEEGDINKCRE